MSSNAPRQRACLATATTPVAMPRTRVALPVSPSVNQHHPLKLRRVSGCNKGQHEHYVFIER